MSPEPFNVETRLADPLADSCGGRGTRATGWFQDYINSKGDTELKSVYLEGGIKGWVGGAGEYVNEVVEFDVNYWKELGVIAA
jgi:hypothetical protein